MNKKIRWIIIGIVAVIIIAISIMAIINEVQLHYKVEEISEYKYFTLEQNQKYGVIDRNGNIVIEAEYGAVQIPNPSKAIFVCVKEYNENTKEYETVVYNEKKEVLLSNYKNVQAISIYTNVNSTPYEKSVLTYKENGKYGLINLEGKQITKPVYDEISSINYKEGTFLVKQNELEGIINMKGKVIIKCEYESVTSDNYYSENGNKKQAGFIVSKKTEDGYRYGYANYRGTIILNPIYTQLERVTEIANEKGVYFIAFKNGQAGLLKNNKEILNYEYERMQQQKIKFTQKIELYKLPVKGEDMMIIMGNLLENAMEASMKCQIEERRIELTIQQINEIVFLDVKNSISDTVNLNGFQSQKADKIMHGWGMKNIKQIVDENHGEMQCACKDGMFDVNIIFMEDKEYE